MQGGTQAAASMPLVVSAFLEVRKLASTRWVGTGQQAFQRVLCAGFPSQKNVEFCRMWFHSVASQVLKKLWLIYRSEHPSTEQLGKGPLPGLSGKHEDK